MKIEKIWEIYKREHVLVNVIDQDRALDAWEHWLKPAFGHRHHTRLTPAVIRAYVNARGANPATAAREIGVMNAAIRHAYKAGKIKYLPFLQKPKGNKPRSRYYSEEEISRLLRQAKIDDLRMYWFIKLSLLSAQRKAAVLTMTWDRVDFANKTLDFNDPTLPLPDRRKGRGFLHMSEQMEEFLGTLPRESKYLVSQNKEPLVSVWTRFKRIADAAGLDGSPHILRHTTASQLVSKGIDLLATSRMLGHKSIKTTEAVYVKLSPSYLRDATSVRIAKD